MKVRASVAYPIMVFIIGCFSFSMLILVENSTYSFAVGLITILLVSVIAGQRYDDRRREVSKLKKEKERSSQLDSQQQEDSVDVVFLVDVIDEEFTITTVNNSFLSLTGIPKHKAIGMKLNELFDESMLAHYKKVFETNSSVEFDDEIMFPLGKKRIDASINPVRQQVGDTLSIVTVLKIKSARLETEELLKETENHYQFIADNATDIILKMSADSTFLYVSPIIEKILGIKPKDILYVKNSYDIIHPDDHEHCYFYHQKMLNSDEIVTFKFRALNLKNQLVWLESTGKRIMTNDEQIELICITRDITERQQLEEQLEFLSYNDELTGVGNRRKFEQTYKHTLQSIGESNRVISVLMVDVDFFKEYNDTFGHLQGDECLKQIAWKLEQIAEHVGTEVFRYGGEEFILIYPHAKDMKPTIFGNRIVKEIENLEITHSSSPISPFVTISLGSVTILEPTVKVNTAIDYADKALYKAKKNGKNRYETYENISMLIG
ncbi:diguanylate cyclase [Bacillus timonensis]|nr:diguanylate cyclase [Bacillus timonensis]